jgi:hypothetical protein
MASKWSRDDDWHNLISRLWSFNCGLLVFAVWLLGWRNWFIGSCRSVFGFTFLFFGYALLIVWLYRIGTTQPSLRAPLVSCQLDLVWICIV